MNQDSLTDQVNGPSFSDLDLSLVNDTLGVSDSLALTALDSLPKIIEAQEFVPGLFQNHLLPVENLYDQIEKSDPANTFGFIVLLFCFACIIYLHRSYLGFFTSVLKAGFDTNLAQQDARTENSQRTRNIMLLQFTALVSFSLFLTFLLPLYYSIDLTPMALFGTTIAITTAFIFAKRTVVWILAQTFGLQHELRFHRFNGSILLSLAGLSLLPLSLLLHYSPYIPYQFVVYTAFGFASFLYLKVVFRGFLLALSSNAISSLHLFYYFCALEILPVFVLIRLAQNM